MSHILLIEPDKQLSKSICSVLEKSGHTVSSAVNGHQAISEADDAKPDLVILEVTLPGHSGFEFLYEFRSYDDWLKVPVIIFTTAKLDPKLIDGPTWEQLDIDKIFYKQDTPLSKLINYIDKILALGNKK